MVEWLLCNLDMIQGQYGYIYTAVRKLQLRFSAHFRAIYLKNNNFLNSNML